MEPAARAHRLEVCAPEQPVPVICDPMRIEQVLGNLIGNAIKYSPSGGAVRIGIAQREEVVVITVADDGVGMSADDVAHAFEPFHRAAASKGVIPGVGLGLYVARKIVEAHGGRIAVDSVLGAGSTFTVFLPHRGTNQRML
jgi:signal transduction histidine kinase